ncbi:hypothetical protein SDC9_183627 [bioreactor metagenome]|uniref:Uncharacterized protein n=1 Tax=bioreactor metagenome TaxID=1076179 RepID=A0A645HAQ6_9ZZZZ
MVQLLPFAKDLFAIGKTIGIVVHKDREVEFLLQNFLQMHLVPVSYVLYIIHDAPLPVHHAWHANAHCGGFIRHQLPDDSFQNIQCPAAPLQGVCLLRQLGRNHIPFNPTTHNVGPPNVNSYYILHMPSIFFESVYFTLNPL